MSTLRLKTIPCKQAELLIVVESICWKQYRSALGHRAHCSLEPIAFVVGSGNSIRAFDIDAEEMDITNIRQQLPELEATLTSFLKRE